MVRQLMINEDSGSYIMKFRPFSPQWVWGLAFTWTLVGLAGTNSAGAQNEVSPSDPKGLADAADRYFFEAKARADQKQWVEALGLLERAWEIKPSHDIAGNLGQVALKLGRYKKATTFLERCLRLFPPTGSAEQRSRIQTLFETARAHVAEVRIVVVPQPGELVIDRVTLLGAVAVPAEPLFVDPGTHIIQIRLNGQVIAESSFLALANASHDVNIPSSDGRTTGSDVRVPNRTSNTENTADSSARAVADAPSDSHVGWLGGRNSWPVLVGTTVSVAGFVSAGLLIDAANGRVGTANRLSGSIRPSSCGAGTQHPSECQALRDANASADARYNWGYAMLGVGSASLLATLGYVLWPSSSSKSAEASSLELIRPLLTGISIQSGGGNIEWVGRF